MRILSVNKCLLVAWLVGYHLLLSYFGHYGVICLCVCCSNSCRGNAVRDFGRNVFCHVCWLSFAVKGFWALGDIYYVYAITL
jgi:hypothetical protein